MTNTVFVIFALIVNPDYVFVYQPVGNNGVVWFMFSLMVGTYFSSATGAQVAVLIGTSIHRCIKCYLFSLLCRTYFLNVKCG